MSLYEPEPNPFEDDEPTVKPTADQRDAARYRWLRKQHWSDSDMFVVTGGRDVVRLGTSCPNDCLLDAAIDKLMKEG